MSDNPAKNDSLSSHQVAIRPDANSRAAYAGRITQTEHVTITSDDGTSFEKEVSFTISWDSILKILGLINIRAGT